MKCNETIEVFSQRLGTPLKCFPFFVPLATFYHHDIPDFIIYLFLISTLTFKTFKMRSSLVLYCLASVIALSISPALGYPSDPEQYEVSTGRKFAEKPNSTKKLTLLEDRNDLEDLATNQLTVSTKNPVTNP